MNELEINFIKEINNYYFDDRENSILVIDKDYTIKFFLDSIKDGIIINPLDNNPQIFDAKINKVSISEFVIRSEDKTDDIKLCRKLFNGLNIYFNLFNEIPFYTIKFSDDTLKSKILYEIELSTYNTINFLSYYIKLKTDETNNFYIPNIKKSCLYKSLQIINYKKITLIQSNTKARRIGYLKFIVKLFEQSSYFPISYFARKIELEASYLYDSLIEYKETHKGDDKGLIRKTQTGISAQPYIDLLKELNIITQINTSYILTKQAKIYSVLNRQMEYSKTEVNFNSPKNNPNIFKLNILDKFFFLKQFLIRDSLYIWSLLDIIQIANKPIGTPSIKKLFVNYVLNELERNNLFSTNNQIKRDISELKKRINSWNKPIVYLEHIIEPRVNWLLDLEILEQTTDISNDKKYILTFYGKNLMAILLKVYESTLCKQQSISLYLDNNYFEDLSFIYNLNKTNNNIIPEKTETYLLEAFKLFKTEAPNRIAASQAIDYVCYKYFIEENIVIEFNDIKQYLSIENITFTLDWFNTENDGTLYLKKK